MINLDLLIDGKYKLQLGMSKEDIKGFINDDSTKKAEDGMAGKFSLNNGDEGYCNLQGTIEFFDGKVWWSKESVMCGSNYDNSITEETFINNYDLTTIVVLRHDKVKRIIMIIMGITRYDLLVDEKREKLCAMCNEKFGECEKNENIWKDEDSVFSVVTKYRSRDEKDIICVLEEPSQKGHTERGEQAARMEEVDPEKEKKPSKFKRCPKCGKIYDNSWSVCLNCTTKLINISEKEKIEFGKKALE
jgi:uncharacterized protein with PIN domain